MSADNKITTKTPDKPKSLEGAGKDSEELGKVNKDNVTVTERRTGAAEQSRDAINQGVAELNGIIIEAGEAAYTDGSQVMEQGVNQIMAEAHTPSLDQAKVTIEAGKVQVEVGDTAEKSAKSMKDNMGKDTALDDKHPETDAVDVAGKMIDTGTETTEDGSQTEGEVKDLENRANDSKNVDLPKS